MTKADISWSRAPPLSEYYRGLLRWLVLSLGAAMRRREFITLLGGAAVVWPLTAHTQQLALPAIGFLDPRTPEVVAARLRGFRQGLKESGYVEGENVAIVYRWLRIKLTGCQRSGPTWPAIALA